MDGLFGNSGGFESIIALAVGSILPESWNPGILVFWFTGKGCAWAVVKYTGAGEWSLSCGKERWGFYF